MVDIESEAGLASSHEQLESFAEALDAARGLTGAAASVNVPSGAISASFSVDATDAAQAADIACSTFRKALAESGFGSTHVVRVAAEHVAAGEIVAA